MRLYRKQYMKEIAEKAQQQAELEERLRREKEELLKERRRLREIRMEELRKIKEKEDYERRIVREKALAEQVKRWRHLSYKRQKEMQNELQYLLVKESPEWITDPGQVKESIFENQVILDGYWPERTPKHMNQSSPKSHEMLLKNNIDLDARFQPEVEEEAERQLRREKERNDKAHRLILEGDEEWDEINMEVDA
eukprot:CAMPEP_0167756352 /NCGR_PEP_ID=MMETSP0110_2-20121227/9340_1 /TAXON_ID=629695 /ORGANISM="Gymnochlora sp., Strain CCMP2014" /LENGTH=194 /DNA_ID=CAMNT_0007642457 /DNA_START=149 /DNA_END=733 /DNA_ORIENTATION=-